MPPGIEQPDSDDERPLQEVVEALDRYPLEAFRFVQQGLGFSVDKFHGELTDPNVSRHISGAQLCDGLREYALLKWGMLARVVLRRWNINSTLDFGRIVFALVESGLLQKTDQDVLEDFRSVYDFRTAFEGEYHIPLENAREGRT
jgi:uncharacterized repeat protein (TIGR04138 family)